MAHQWRGGIWHIPGKLTLVLAWLVATIHGGGGGKGNPKVLSSLKPLAPITSHLLLSTQFGEYDPPPFPWGARGLENKVFRTWPPPPWTYTGLTALSNQAKGKRVVKWCPSLMRFVLTERRTNKTCLSLDSVGRHGEREAQTACGTQPRSYALSRRHRSPHSRWGTSLYEQRFFFFFFSVFLPQSSVMESICRDQQHVHCSASKAPTPAKNKTHLGISIGIVVGCLWISEWRELRVCEETMLALQNTLPVLWS